MKPRRLAALAFVLATLAVAVWFFARTSDSKDGAAIATSERDSERANPARGALNDSTSGRERVGAETIDASSHSSDPRSEFRVELAHRSRRISARIVDEAGRPIAGGELALESGEWRVSSLADDTGRATIVTALPKAIESSRRLAIEASAHGFAPLRAERELADEPAIHLGDLELALGSTLSGRVFDSFGAPVSRARVLLAQPIDAARVDAAKRNGPSEPQLPRSMEPREETTTDACGEFHFDGVRAGHWSLWAGRGDKNWDVRPSISLAVGATNEFVELRLGEVDASRSVRGRVVDPARTPLANVRVELVLASQDGDGWNTTTSDSDGRFHFDVADDRPRKLRATTERWEWDPAELEGVRAGDSEVELALRESNWLWVHVTTESGEPLVQGRVRANAVDRGHSFDRAVSDMWPDGRARLHRPDADFTLSIDAPNCDDSPFGPFDLANVREPIELVAKPAHGLGGRVTFENEPVANARVALHLAPPTGKVLSSTLADPSGAHFVARASELVGSETRTDRDGRFALKKPPPNVLDREFVLCVESDGRATAESAPTTWNALDPSRDVDFELVHGNALEGRVNLRSGASPEGWRVIALDEYGALRSSSVGADSKYRIQGLHAGAWQVRAFRPGPQPSAIGWSIVSACEPKIDVVIGATDARFDLELDDARLFLRGVLRAHNGELGAWKAGLWRRTGLEDVELDPDGAFRFEIARGEDYRLWIGPLRTESYSLSITDRFSGVRDSIDWNFELATGTLRGKVASAKESNAWTQVLCSWRGAGELHVETSTRPDANGDFGPMPVAVGTSELHVVRATAASRENSNVPPRTIEIVEDRELTIELP